MSDAFPPPGTQKTLVTEGNQSNLMQNMTQAGQPMQQAQQRQMGMPLGAVFNSSLGNNLMQTASPLEQPMGMPIPYDSTNTTTQQDMMGRNREASQTNLMQTMSQGKGNRSYSPTSGQPAMGQPNPYPNTIGMGDNSANTPSTGKGKGA